jgi:2-phospho-L-lactate guanylyltransferase
MTEHLVAVVPVRSLQNGKTRLATVLAADQRASLLRRTGGGVISAARRSRLIESVLVISPDGEALAWAEALGSDVVPLPQGEGAPGLNGAIEMGRRWALERGATAIVSLFADLPLLSANDVRRLVERPEAVVLGADRHGEGTNALLLRLTPPGDGFQFAFGAGSLARHVREARRLGLDVALLDAVGVAFDLDTPGDWSDYLALTAGESAGLDVLDAQEEACAR